MSSLDNASQRTRRRPPFAACSRYALWTIGTREYSSSASQCGITQMSAFGQGDRLLRVELRTSAAKLLAANSGRNARSLLAVIRSRDRRVQVPIA